MGLIKLNGSGFSTSLPSENDGIKPVVDVAELYDATPLEQTVQNSYYNEDYLREEQAKAIQDALATTVQGASIFVTYYKQIQNNVADRTNQADNVIAYDSVHHAFFKILHFEMKIQGSLEFNFEQEPSISQWQGAGLTFPYFKPAVSDYFTYEVEEGKLGLFKVNSVKRLSIRSATWSQINFEMVNYPVNEDNLQFLTESVSDTYYFNTERFLATDGSLLKSDEADIVEKLTIYRSNLIDYFYTKFFDNSYHHTFIRPDGVYDPYLITFWYQLEEPCRNALIPTRLIDKPEFFKQSIWYQILFPEFSIRDPLIPSYNVVLWTCHIWETVINSLINREYVLLNADSTAEDSIAYPLCDYDAKAAAGNRLGILEKNFLEDRIVDTTLLVAEILSTASKEPLNMFYETPFLIYLCDCVIRKLKYNQG